MQTQEISYDADGMRAVGYLALPDGDDQRPGVLVCHEGPGIDDHEPLVVLQRYRQRCDPGRLEPSRTPRKERNPRYEPDLEVAQRVDRDIWS